MSKASEWQADVVRAALATKMAEQNRPVVKGWSPGDADWSATALSGETMLFTSKRLGAGLEISRPVALKVARWILDTFEEQAP